ncbi:MAG: hypothetical protein AAFQ94_22850 [Bacteroidota bacterium]
MSKEETLKAAEERIINEITSNEKYKCYFDQFQESSVDPFVKNYAEKKAQLEVYGDYTKFQQERTLKRFQTEGWEALREIQHKKLFDTECLWRAEEIPRPSEVLATKDFDMFAENILDYDGIEPITDKDIELYQQYLRKPQQLIKFGSHHSHYSEFRMMKNEYLKNGDTFNEYFDYHNLMTGNHKLLFLPDIREEKELEYVHFRDQHESKKEQKKVTPKPVTPQKPFLRMYDDDQLTEFAKLCDDRKMVNFIKDYKVWISERPDFVYDWAFEYLSDVSPERVPIRANHDWKEAIYFAAADHKSNRIADILPTLHQEYLIKKDAGILMGEYDKDSMSIYKMISDRWRNLILEGRKLKGEPEDFNF